MRGFPLSVTAKAGGEASIGATIGVHHQDHPPGAVQAHGFANLLQDKFTLRLEFRRGQALGATRDFDRVGIRDAEALEKFSKSQLEPVVEAPEDSRVAMILFARSVAMKNLFHDDPFALALIRFSHASCSGIPQ